MVEHAEEDGFVDLSAKAKGSKGHKRPSVSMDSQPVEYSDILKRQATMLADSLFERIHELRKLTGKSPYKGEKVSSEERNRQYQELKVSHVLLVDEIASNTTIGAAGELRINKELLKSFMEFSDA